MHNMIIIQSKTNPEADVVVVIHPESEVVLERLDLRDLLRVRYTNPHKAYKSKQDWDTRECLHVA